MGTSKGDPFTHKTTTTHGESEGDGQQEMTTEVHLSVSL